jgi:tetratricopeptide (TPR) repeat protein
MVATEAGGMIHKTVFSFVLIVGLWIFELRADENQAAGVDQSSGITVWIKQLNAPNYADRKEAFLKLCDPSLDIEAWVKNRDITDDPQLASTLGWLQRIRSLPGSIDARLEAACDFPALVQGSVQVVERYAKEGKLELLLEMVRLLPKGSRDILLQNAFTRGESALEHVFDGAWAMRKPELIPKFLEVILPVHPLRIGLNRRWSMLGLTEPWQLQVPLDTNEMQIAALQSEGQIAQAVELARQTMQPGEIEKLLIRNKRWKEWLALEPTRLSMISATWSELPRVLILEALDQHQEALKYYESRKSANAKGVEQQFLLTHLALVTGDTETVFAKLKESDSGQLTAMYFLHNRIDELMELEDLKERTPVSVSAWIDRNIVEGKGFTKAVRFQALFRRLGETPWSDAILTGIIKFIDNHPRDQRIRFWKEYIEQTMRYSLDELRPELLAIALGKLESDGQPKRKASNGVAGFPEAQEERELTIEDLFRESFPYMKEASYPLYQTMRREYPDKPYRKLIEWLQLLHQGVLPEGWSQSQVLRVFQGAAMQRIVDGASASGCVIDLAEALETMDMVEDAIELLKTIPGVTRADLMRSRYLWKIGKYNQSRELVLECLEHESSSLDVYQWAFELFGLLGDKASQKLLDSRVLTRPNGMEVFARYSQEMRRGERFELPEPIGRFLELQHDSFPSSLGNLWLDDMYWGWNLSLLANHYHKTAPDFPERIDRNFDLSLTSCLIDIFTEVDSLSSGMPRAGRARPAMDWDLDWSQWAWRYERVFSAGFWQAVQNGDRERADRFLRAAHRINPEQINTLIDAVPWVLEKFDRQTLRDWFLIYYEPMQEHLKKYPKDTLIANNSAWLAVKCGFELDRAMELSQMVVDRHVTDNYLDTLAEVHFVQGNIDKAIETSLQCRKLNPRDPHHRRQITRYNQGLHSHK